MLRVEPEHQPIEKPPPAARTVEEEPIHWRRQPDDPKPLAERHLAARRFSVDAHDPPLTRCRVTAGADPHRAVPRGDDRSDGPTRIWRFAVSFGAAIDLGQLGAAQPAAWCKKRQRFQQIGLAGAVRPGEHHGLGAEGEPRLAIIAKIGQYEPRHTDALTLGTGTAAGFLCLSQHRNYIGSRTPSCQHSAALVGPKEPTCGRSPSPLPRTPATGCIWGLVTRASASGRR